MTVKLNCHIYVGLCSMCIWRKWLKKVWMHKRPSKGSVCIRILSHSLLYLVLLSVLHTWTTCYLPSRRLSRPARKAQDNVICEESPCPFCVHVFIFQLARVINIFSFTFIHDKLNHDHEVHGMFMLLFVPKHAQMLCLAIGFGIEAMLKHNKNCVW